MKKHSVDTAIMIMPMFLCFCVEMDFLKDDVSDCDSRREKSGRRRRGASSSENEANLNNRGKLT